jgi:hypothetical protein
MSQDSALTEPHEVLYGTQTRLSLENFGVPARRIGDIPTFIRYYALVKSAAAAANRSLGVLDDTRAAAIIAACDEVAAGLHADQFPTALVLGGGGTTTNMNINEVIATRATQIASAVIHPNDHVNASQSTNDTIPTAMALTIIKLAEAPSSALQGLAVTLVEKAAEYDETLYLGRTCLQDAVSVRVGKTFRAQARAIRRGADGLENAVRELSAVPLGATVLGTSIGAPEGFAQVCMEELRISSTLWRISTRTRPWPTLPAVSPLPSPKSLRTCAYARPVRTADWPKSPSQPCRPGHPSCPRRSIQSYRNTPCSLATEFGERRTPLAAQLLPVNSSSTSWSRSSSTPCSTSSKTWSKPPQPWRRSASKGWSGTAHAELRTFPTHWIGGLNLLANPAMTLLLPGRRGSRTPVPKPPRRTDISEPRSTCAVRR